MEELGIDLKKAQDLVDKYITSDITRYHLLESEAIMRAVAIKLSEDEEGWGLLGLLHDIDWDLTKTDVSQHCIKCAEILKNAGASGYFVDTVQSHGWGKDGVEAFRNKQRSTKVQHALAASETLTGLIVASALVQPDKKLASVKFESLQKKFRDKSFAARCDRDIILECEKLGLSVEEFLGIGLKALQDISSDLGL